MSCGEPHDMDCRDVIEAVYLYLDGEMPDDDCHHIREHLDECSPCLRQFGVEQDIKALVARKCGCESAPSDLKVRVLARLRAVRVQLDHTEFRVE